MRTTRRPSYLTGPTPRVIAHRGFGGPGNTAEAFQRALDAGADLLETDVRASVDGVAVLLHDAEIVDSAGATHRVDRTRWEELRCLVLEGGEHLVGLAEALERFPDARFNIDVKARSAIRPTVDAVRAARAEERVLIASFAESRRSTAARALPGAATSASGPRFIAALLGAHLRVARVVRVALAGIDALQVPERALGLAVTETDVLARLRASGCEIHVWTVNDPARMRVLLDLGVDGLITDRTDLARVAVDAVRAGR